MPDMYFTGSGPINLPAGTQLCTLALDTPARPRIELVRVCVSFDGTSSTAVPVNCVIAKITNTPAGSAIPASYGPNCLDLAGPTAGTTAACPSTATPGVWTTAPTMGAVLWEMDIPPTTGLPEWFPLGQMPKISASTWVGVFLNAPAAVTVRTSLYHLE